MGFLSIDLLLPAGCVHCSKPVPRGFPLCEVCLSTLDGLASSEHVRHVPGTIRSWSAFAYAGAARSLVHSFKYRGGAALAAVLARELARRAPPTIWRDAVLVPVPAHPHNRARRGYSQCELLAEALGTNVEAPVFDLLVRTTAYSPQAGSRRAQRLRLDEDAFRIVESVTGPNSKIPQIPTNVVLLDDVRTTGVTLEVCASLLSDWVHGEVRAVTFANAHRTRPN